MFCEGKDQVRYFGYLKIEILLDIQVELCRRIEREVRTEDEKLGVINRQVAFNDMELEETTQGDSIVREDVH